MSFDLTNKNIQDTFQNLLQKTGSDGRLHDLVGNQVDDLTLTNVSASGHISASKFVGDGSQLTGLSSAAISTYNTSGDNRVITSVNSSTVQGESNLTFDGTGLNVNGNITSSGNISGSGTIQSTGDISTDGHLNILNNKKLQIDGGDTFVQLSDNTIQIDGDNQVNLSGDIHIKLNTPTVKVEGDISSSNAITSSKVLVKAPNATDDFFLLKSGSLDSLKVNNQGVLVLGGFTFTPSAIRGGMYYDQDDDEFYAGKNN